MNCVKKYGEVFRTKYSRIDQVKIFKDYLPQFLLGPFLNTLSHLCHCQILCKNWKSSIIHVWHLLLISLLNSVGVFGVILVSIFPHLDWIRRDISHTDILIAVTTDTFYAVYAPELKHWVMIYVGQSVLF